MLFCYCILSHGFRTFIWQEMTECCLYLCEVLIFVSFLRFFFLGSLVDFYWDEPCIYVSLHYTLLWTMISSIKIKEELEYTNIYYRITEIYHRESVFFHANSHDNLLVFWSKTLSRVTVIVSGIITMACRGLSTCFLSILTSKGSTMADYPEI